MKGKNLVQAKEYIIELEDELLTLAKELKTCRTRLLELEEENKFLKTRIGHFEEERKDKSPF